MITNKQKIVLCLLSLIATFIAVIVVLPFNVLFSRLGIASENVQTIELLCKFVVIPLIVIGVSIYPILLRRSNYYTQLDVSVSATKMSFIPSAMYLSALTGWIGGVMYASVSHTNTLYLIQLSALWSFSVIIMFFFGIFTKWLHRLTGKQMLLANILNLLLVIVGIIICFLVYKSLPVVQEIQENNAFLKMLLYVCMFMFSLLFLWQAIFSEETTPVVLENGEEFTEEEKEEIIVDLVDVEIQSNFDKYYLINKGKYLEELKEKNNLEEQ